jgi:hypothetical protein
MAATVSAAYSALLTITQTMTGEFVGSDDTFTVDGLNATGTLNASSTPPATKQANGTKAMVAAAGTAWTVVLDPGQWCLFYLDDNAPDVAAGAKTIDLAGTTTQELDYVLVFG